MNTRKISLLIVVLFTGLLMFNGCKKSEPTSTEALTEKMAMEGHEGHDQDTDAEKTTEDVATVEQKTCPVMGGPINKSIFIEYKDKKIYFCCEPCKEKFEAHPEQYIAKLPQFNQ